MNTPLITVVTVVRNGVSTLERTIQSVINQTYKNIEYIIIDGASTDGTVDIIKKYEKHLAYWVSEPDKGIYDAWNKGLTVAKGNWICFVGADDELYYNHTETYVNFIMSSPSELEYVASKVDYIDENGLVIKVIGKPYSWSYFKRRMNCAHVGSMHSVNYFKEYGTFNPDFRVAGDYELLLRAKNKLRAGYIDISTVKMQTGGISADRYRYCKELWKAKVLSGGRNKYIALLEESFFTLRSIIEKLLKFIHKH